MLRPSITTRLSRDSHIDESRGILIQICKNMLPISHNLDQFPQNRELELQLDAVDRAFEGLLIHQQVEVFNHQQPNVKRDDEDVDGEEFGDGAAGCVSFHDSEEFGGFIEVDSGDEAFLQHENRHLKLLDVGPGGAELRLVVAVVGGEADDCGGRV